MAKVDFSRLKKLPPNMRIKALKQLEEEFTKLIEARKKEIEEAQLLLKEAKHELEIIEEIETPKVKTIEVEKLFAKEEKTEETPELEKIAAEAPRGLPAEQESYAKFMAEQMSMEQIYNRLQDIQQEQTKTGIETTYQQNFVEAADRALYFKRQAEEKGIYIPSEKSEELLTTAEKLIKYLKGNQ